VGIENTPPYSREKCDKIDAFFMKFIKYNGLNTIFKINDQVSRSHDSFILKYEEGQIYGQALTGHRDGGKQHVLSIIFTININTCGGRIILSNRDDEFLQQNSNYNDEWTLHPQDNSIYCFNGSFVEHRVLNITKGTRYAMVAFFPTEQTREDVVRLWNPHFSSYTCYNCCLSYQCEV
jgi:energy-coupling factor transporter ATP-binding protein EcfA2